MKDGRYSPKPTNSDNLKITFSMERKSSGHASKQQLRWRNQTSINHCCAFKIKMKGSSINFPQFSCLSSHVGTEAAQPVCYIGSYLNRDCWFSPLQAPSLWGIFLSRPLPWGKPGGSQAGEGQASAPSSLPSQVLQCLFLSISSGIFFLLFIIFIFFLL